MAILKPPGWTLQVEGGKALTLAAWGLEGGRLFTASLQVDEFTASRPVQKIEDPPICPFGTRVILRDATGAVRFIGKRVDIDQAASGPAEHQLYRFANAWWDLGKRIYHQLWTTWTQAAGQPPVASQSYNPHLILNVGRSVGQEITSIIQYAASQGVDIAVGTIDANVFPPPDEVINRDCASIIAQLLAFAPDNVCWFDYPANGGTPIFHCREPDLVKSAPLPDGPEDFAIRARNEDVASAVAIRYERTDEFTSNGVTRQYPVIFTDVAPANATGREERALSETVQLAGFSRSEVSAELVCASLPANFESGGDALAFWTRFYPQFSDDRAKLENPLITPGSFARAAEELGDGEPAQTLVLLPRYLIAGEIAPWMIDSTGGELAWQKQVFGAKFNFNLFDSRDEAIAGQQFGLIYKARNLFLTAKLTATNAPAGVSEYKMQTAFTEGEQPPVGLAQYLYDRLSLLGYSGRYRRVQSECDGAIRLGHLLNVTGGDPAWAGMQAAVQSTEEDIDTGSTTIQFGIAPGLSLGRILELLRNGRTRRRWTAIEQQQNGEIGSAGAVEFGRVTADSNSTPGNRVNSYFAVREDTKKVSLDAQIDHQIFLERSDVPAQYIQAQLLSATPESVIKSHGAGGTVFISTADCNYLGIPRTVSIRAVKSCDPSDPPGSNWARLVLCSDRIRLS
jgi:hypothetical protein